MSITSENTHHNHILTWNFENNLALLDVSRGEEASTHTRELGHLHAPSGASVPPQPGKNASITFLPSGLALSGLRGPGYLGAGYQNEKEKEQAKQPQRMVHFCRSDLNQSRYTHVCTVQYDNIYFINITYVSTLMHVMCAAVNYGHEKCTVCAEQPRKTRCICVYIYMHHYTAYSIKFDILA
jgi:hypothetical protein